MWTSLVTLFSRLGFAWARRRLDSEARAEFDAHLDLLVERYIRSGMTPGEAHAAARLQLGNLTLVREEVYTLNGIAWVDGLAQDLRYAFRQLRRAASTGAIQTLGSPNAAWRPGVGCVFIVCVAATIPGGMTADGSVVAMSFSGGDGQYGYFHNTHGWFHLTSALAANGVDIAADGWETNSLGIQGISSDGTLVFGAGVHNDKLEGFVAEFGPGVLAGFNPQPVPPANTSLVGVWTFDADISAPGHVVVFTADGAYYHIEGEGPFDELSGFEWGNYTFDGSGIAFTTRLDTNGSTGLSDTNGQILGPITITEDTLIFEGAVEAYRIAGSPGTLVGGWVLGDPTQPDNSVVIVFTSGGKYFFAQDGSGTGSSRDSIEIGTFTWDATSGLLEPDASGGVDTNGDGGLFAGVGQTRTVNLTGDELGFVLVAGSEVVQFTRVIDPATVAAVQGDDATATLGTAFIYQVSATNANGFEAVGLPDGLNIDSGSGEISGTPLEAGFFPVTVSATNPFGSPKSATLNLTVVSTIVTTAGTGVSITPEVPPGTPGMTMTFDNVTTGGDTTVAVLDAETSPAPPSGFQIGSQPLYYEISTNAVLAPNTSVTICFNYAGIDFGGQTPRLFHYVAGSWVDITTSVDAATTTLCGSTSSFSLFAIFSSPRPFVRGTGFYSPVSPLPGFVNSSKAGSTVPLKFNVYVNGQEKTDEAGLAFSVTTIACTLAPEDPVNYVTQPNTNLRYTGHQFHLNWKTPKTPGCYIARVTNADGLLLSAIFRLK